MSAGMAGEQAQTKSQPAESPAQPSPGFGDLAPGYRYGAIIAAACSGASVLAHFGLGARGVISAGFVVVLAILAAIDLEHGVIPNRILVPAGCALLTAQIAFFPHQAVEWILAGLGAGLVLLIPALVRRDALGMGDVKLGVFLGVGLGKAVIGGLLLGSLAAVPFALAILVRQGTAGRKQRIPLGPFLAVGGLLALLLSSSV